MRFANSNLVHAVGHGETYATYGRTICGISYTRDEEHLNYVVPNDGTLRVGIRTQTRINCIGCIGKGAL